MSRFIPALSLAFIPLVGLLSAQGASAHVELTNPPARVPGSTSSQLKIGPCGQTPNGRTETVTEYAPGETITVEFDEFINHPSYYRVAFDIDGDDDFPLRTDMDSVDPATDDPAAVNPVGDVVLAYVEDGNGGSYSVDVTLPNVECENCTLQLIQFMYDKVGNQLDDEYYFQCADIALRGEVSPGAGGADGGGAGGTDAGAGGDSAAGGDSSAGGDSAAGGDMGIGGGDAAGGAAAGGAAANAGGTPGLIASGGSLAGDGGTAAGGAETYPEGMDPGAMDDDGSDEGGCSFHAPAKMSPFTGLLLLLGLGGFARRRRRI